MNRRIQQLFRSVLLAVPLLLVAAGPAEACSTGYAPTVREIGALSRLIVLADVVAAPADGLRYRLHVIRVVRGNGIRPGTTITIGPATAPPEAYPYCWLRLVVGTRVVVALPDTKDLGALSSYAWWEQGGHVSSASAVDSWPDSIDGLLVALAAGIPPDTATEEPPSPNPAALWLVLGAAIITGAGVFVLRRPVT